MRGSRSLHGRGRSEQGGLHHRDQGQEHHDRARGAPAHRARLSGPGRRQHRAPTVGPRGGRGTGSEPEPEPDYWIIETSSFQVPDLARASHVVAVTSLSPDHLDWHGTVRRYYEDKLSLCTKPGVTVALADGSDTELRAQTALLGPHLRWVNAAAVEHDAAWSESLSLPGPHNARQRIHRAGRADRTRHRGGRRRRASGGGGQRLRRIAQPLPLARSDRGGRVRRRQPLDQRVARASRIARIRDPGRRLARGRPRPRRRLRATRDEPSPRAPRRPWSSRCPTTDRASAPRCAGPPTASRSSTHPSLEGAVKTAFTWAASNDGADGRRAALARRTKFRALRGLSGPRPLPSPRPRRVAAP